MGVQLTRHAQARAQQRGISQEIIDLLLSYGKSEYDKRGGKIVYFNNACRKRISRILGVDVIRSLGKKLNAYLVLCGDDVVTVGWRYDRINRN